MVAPWIVGSPSKFEAASSGATITLTKPDGVQDGDMLIAALRTNGTNSPSDFGLSGWTRRGYAFRPNDASGRVMGIYTHPVTDAGSEPGSYVFTKTVSDTRRVGVLAIVRGVDLADPIVGDSENYQSASPPTVTIDAYALDDAAASLAVYAWATEVVAPNSSTPSATPGTQIALAQSSPGTGSTRTTLWTGFEEIAATTHPQRGLTWVSSTGASATGVTLRGLDAPPEPPPAGFASVSALLATPGATWAHRGGSTNWPEMSLYAYQQAAAAGYGALEFSAQRTSDGVWVGLHDANLNRTSQTSGLPAVSSMTWAEVQAYQNTLNSSGTPRPYYRLDDFLEDWTGTHVVIVDNKTNGNHAEFFDMLDANGGPSKIIAKAYGVGTGGGAGTMAAARGYESWGYFYESDLAAIPANQGTWTLLGMNFDASQSAWDAVLSYGKPVVGHIAASQANYNTALVKGARMVQCANVAGITAVGASTLTGDVTVSVALSGTRTMDTARTGSVTVIVDATATRTVGVDRDGTVSVAVGVSGEASTDTARTGSVSVPVGIDATRTVNTQRSGDITATVELVGSAAADTARTGTVSVAVEAAGTVESGSVVRTGEITVAVGFTAERTANIERAGIVQVTVTATGVIQGDMLDVPDVRTLIAVDVDHTLTPVSFTRTLEDA